MQRNALNTLRKRLRRLGRERQVWQWAVGLSVLGLTLLGGLAVAFFVDFFFALDVPARATLLVLVALCAVWWCRRRVLPWFQRGESERQLALLVEQLHGIDTDLVAALEFARHGDSDTESTVLPPRGGRAGGRTLA